MNIFQNLLNPQSAGFGYLVAFIWIWSLPWKTLALWHASKNNGKIWFIVFLLFNTIGILEIAYLFYFSKPRLTMEKFKQYTDFKK